jgi:hypothetical protein
MTTRSAVISVVLLGATANPASAGWLDGWNARRDDCAPCTRHAEAEYRGALERAKHLTQLNCAGLSAYSEAARAGYNRRALTAYQAEGPRSAAPASPAPPPPVSPPASRSDAAEPPPAEPAALPR